MIHLKENSSRVVREGLRQLSLNFSKFNLISSEKIVRQTGIARISQRFLHFVKQIGQHEASKNSTRYDEKDVAA